MISCIKANLNCWTLYDDIRCFPCTRLFLGGNCSMMKGNLFQCKYVIYEECSSHFCYIARLFCLFAYLWHWFTQQILTEQARSFIKGLGNKDSIELLRHNDFFPCMEGCLLSQRWGPAGTMLFTALHSLQEEHKVQWNVDEHSFILSRVRPLFYFRCFLSCFLLLILANPIEFKYTGRICHHSVYTLQEKDIFTLKHQAKLWLHNKYIEKSTLLCFSALNYDSGT